MTALFLIFIVLLVQLFNPSRGYIGLNRNTWIRFSDIPMVGTQPAKTSTSDLRQDVIDLSVSNQNINIGRPHTDSSRAKISAANKGKVPWNVGKSHSEETRNKIAEKTREAMQQKKIAKLAALGMTMEDYDLQRVQKRKEKKRSAVKGGLTDEGRKRISESVKERWKNPEFRAKYSSSQRGARNHSEATRARISEAITLKWQQQEYRDKVKSKPSDEVRARISETLKSKWKEEEFRNKMMSLQFPRTEAWRIKLSESIKTKWLDPEYRASVESGIRSSNKTTTRAYNPSNRPRRSQSRSVSTPRKPRISVEDMRAKKRAERLEKKEKEHARKMAFKMAKEEQKKTGGTSRLKELLGRELWFEEKMKRRQDGDRLLDDESLEKQLAAEFYAGRGSFNEGEDEDEDDDDDEEDDEDDDEEENSLYNIPRRRVVGDEEDDLFDGADYEEIMNIPRRQRTEAFSSDVIEVYDEEGNLVGTYTDAEFEELRKQKSRS